MSAHQGPFSDPMYGEGGGALDMDDTDLLSTFNRRRATENDYIIAIAASSTTPMSGTGKTTLAVQLARYMDQSDSGWSAERKATLSSQEVSYELLPNCEHKSALVFDEAQGTAQSDGVDARRAMSDEVLKMSRAAATYRYKQPALIIVTQSTRWLDSRMMDFVDRVVLIQGIMPDAGVARAIVFDSWFDDLASSRNQHVSAKEEIYWQPLPEDDPDYQTLHELKVESGKPDPQEEEEDEGVSIAELAQKTVENGLATHLSWHGGHHKWTISTDRLHDAHDITYREAKRLKDHLVENPEIDVQEIGDEEKGRPV